MQEDSRVVRCYSEDTERPYFQIRYRLSLTGKELLADALSGNPTFGLMGGRPARSESVSTTVSMAPNGAQDPSVFGGGYGFNGIHSIGGDEQVTNRMSRSRSLEGPNSPGNYMNDFSGFQGSGYRFPPPHGSFPESDGNSHMDIDSNQVHELRRSKSAGTASEFHMNRGAPAISMEDLQNVKNLEEMYPEFAPEFRGLVTCLNSKNVRKYRVGQPYRKGVIIGIDEEQGKIIVFQRNMPVGTLVVMRSDDTNRYEKGYTVQDIQGRILGTVHAIDRMQKLLVVNTSAAL